MTSIFVYNFFSGKSQILFAVVFTTRYLDLFTNFISLYNTTMKIFFLASSYGTLYLMYMKFKATYDSNHDTFRLVKILHEIVGWFMKGFEWLLRVSKSTQPKYFVHDCSLKYFRIEFLLGPAVILALVLNHEFSFMEILWTFSIYLESVAILPQLFMVQKTGEAETITSHYLFALGSYRGLYILNWIYRYYFEGTYVVKILNFQSFIFEHFCLFLSSFLAMSGISIFLSSPKLHFINSRNLFHFQASMISSQLWLAAFRRFCIATSSICTSPRCWKANEFNCPLNKAKRKKAVWSEFVKV